MSDIQLDASQRHAVESQAQHTLVVAGAGSGKTSVLTARIRHLIASGVAADRILALAFARDAVSELTERLSEQWGIDGVQVSTFHALALRLLRMGGQDRFALTDDVTGTLQTVLRSCGKHLAFRRTVLSFLASRFEDGVYLALDGRRFETCRERKMANSLFCRHGRYIYPFLSYQGRFAAVLSQWFSGFYCPVAKQTYVLCSNRFAAWALSLILPDDRIVLTHVPDVDVSALDAATIDRLWRHADVQRQWLGLFPLLIAGVADAKKEGFTPSDCDVLPTDGDNPSAPHFLRVVAYLQDAYIRYCDQQGISDFDSVIQRAATVLSASPVQSFQGWDHILVDEFQDISRPRMALLQHLVARGSNCRLFCVGDDYQSVYRFAGSNVSYFVGFESLFPDAAVIPLARNYRSTAVIVAAGSQLMRANLRQRHKQISARQPGGSRIRCVALPKREDFDEAQYLWLCSEIDQLLANEDCCPNDILILARLNRHLDRYEGFAKARGIRLMSVHKSKGLEASHVYVLSVYAGGDGFPYQRQTSPYLKPFKAAYLDDDMAEERRLFYVAVTRSKRYLTLMTQHHRHSPFIRELGWRRCRWVRF